jgi:hypothetical protein
MVYALGAGELFNITAKEEYVETIIGSFDEPYPIDLSY